MGTALAVAAIWIIGGFLVATIWGRMCAGASRHKAVTSRSAGLGKGAK